MKNILLQVPVLVGWGINSIWSLACFAAMIDVLWERFGPDNPYYGEAISMAPNMPMLALFFLLYFAAVVIPVLVLLSAYKKFILLPRGLTPVVIMAPRFGHGLSISGWVLAGGYFAFLLYLNWNVWRNELPDPEFGWWPVLGPLIWTDIVYGGGAIIAGLLIRWRRARATSEEGSRHHLRMLQPR